MVDSMHEKWNVWIPFMIHLFGFSYTETVDLCRNDFLGQLLIEWFSLHSPTAQHDAGEFSGWFRDILLAKSIVSRMPQIHGWESRFEANIEDKGCLHVPVVLRYLPPDAQILQALIEACYDNVPYNGIIGPHALCCPDSDRPQVRSVQLILSRCILGPASHLILVRDEGVIDTSSDVFIRRFGNSEEEINIAFTKWGSLYSLGDTGLYNNMNQPTTCR